MNHLARRWRYVPTLPQVKALTFKITLYERLVEFIFGFVLVVIVLVVIVLIIGQTEVAHTLFSCERRDATIAIFFIIGVLVRESSVVADNATVIRLNGIEAEESVDLVTLFLTCVLYDKVEDIIAVVTQTHEEELRTVCHVIDQVGKVIEFDLSGFGCIGYEVRVCDKEQHEGENLIIGNESVLVFESVDLCAYRIHIQGVAYHFELVLVAFVLELVTEELAFVCLGLLEQHIESAAEIHGIRMCNEGEEFSGGNRVIEWQAILDGLDESCFSVVDLICVHSEPP